jgi:hypothetical protein
LSAGISSAADTIFFEARSTLYRTAFDTGFTSGALACCAAEIKGMKASRVPQHKNLFSFIVASHMSRPTENNLAPKRLQVI